jgi:cellulose synthase operon protein C
MRTFNVRLFAILVASVAVFGVGIYLLHGFQVKRNAYVFLEVADQYHEEARNARRAQNLVALQELQKKELGSLKEYCSKRPDDIDAAERLGNLYMELGQLPNAMSTFEKVLRRAGDDRSDLRRKLVEVGIDWGTIISQQRNIDEKLRNAQSTPLFTAARDHLENYLLKEKPDDGMLLDLLGRCQEGLNQNKEAAATLEKAIAAAPGQVETYRRLAWLLLGMKKPKEADQWMEKLLEVNGDSYRAQFLAADYYLRLKGSLDAAVEAAAKAVELVGPALLKADQAARQDPDDSDLQRAYQMAFATQRLALLVAARSTMEKATRIADDRKHAEAVVLFGEARKYARQAVKLSGDKPEPYDVLADIELRSARLDEIMRTASLDREAQLRCLRKAEAVLREGLKATNNHIDLMWRMANMMIDAEQTEAAGEFVTKLREADCPDPLLAYLEARIAMTKSDWQKAIDGLDRARSGLSGAGGGALQAKQVDFWLGKCYGQLGNPDQEQDAYRRALAADPNYTAAKEALAICLLQSGHIDNALAEYENFTKLGRTPAAAALALARMLIYRNQRLGPEQRKWTQVEDLLQKAATAAPDSVQIPLLQSEMLVARNQAKAAEELVRKARDKSPKEIALWMQLAALAQRRNDLDEVAKILDEAEKKLGDSVELRLARASYIVQRYPEDAAKRLKELAENTASFTDAERIRLWNGLHIPCLQANDLPQARRLCEKVADSQPHNVQARFRLFELAQAAQDEAGMKKVLDEVKKIEGEGPLWCYGEALRLRMAVPAGRTDDPRLDQALVLLARAGKSRPAWAEIPRWMGNIYDQQGKSAEALRQFQLAIKLGERREMVYLRTAQLLARQKRFPDAEQLIQEFETRQGALSPEMRLLQGYLQQERGDVESALESAQETAASSTDYRAHLRLGELLFTRIRQAAAKSDTDAVAKLSTEAEKALRRAVELADQNPETWLPLVRFLCATGQAEKAKEAVGQVRKKLPAHEIQTPLTLAQCYEALGELPAAQEQYETALEAAPDNPAVVRAVVEFYWRTGRPQQADAQLQRILDRRLKTDPADIQWARRVRAAILLGQGGYHNQEKARAMIEQNLAEDPASTADQRLKASILSALPDRARKDEAVGILERLVASSETRMNEDWYNLGLLYLGRNDWAKFNGVMRRLLAAAGDDPRYVATYIVAALQRNELQDADSWLDNLQKIAPNQFNATNLRAELLVRRGKYEEAFDLLKGFVDRPAAQPADVGARRQMVSETLERLGRMVTGPEKQLWELRYLREAENLLKLYVSERPGQEMLAISFLGRQGNFNEAMTLLERIWPRMNPVAISQVILPLLQSGRPSKEQLQRGERLLQSAIERFDRPVPLLMVQADLWTLHGRYEEAESLYREILAKNSNNPPPVALNNLAVLLAMQGVKLDEAAKLIDRAIAASGPVAAMLDSRATVYIALKQADKALADLKNALAEAERPERLFHLALAYHLKGDDTAAADALRKANKLGLTSAELHPLERPRYRELQKLIE